MVANVLVVTEHKIHGIVKAFAERLDHFRFKIGSFGLESQVILLSDLKSYRKVTVKITQILERKRIIIGFDASKERHVQECE
jgi:hypothetical protein